VTDSIIARCARERPDDLDIRVQSSNESDNRLFLSWPSSGFLHIRRARRSRRLPFDRLKNRATRNFPHRPRALEAMKKKRQRKTERERERERD